MAKYLVTVESPSKIKTIKKFCHLPPPETYFSGMDDVISNSVETIQQIYALCKLKMNFIPYEGFSGSNF